MTGGWGLKLPAHRAGLPGKEEICLLRPLSPPTGRGLRVALPVHIRLALRFLRVLHLTVPYQVRDKLLNSLPYHRAYSMRCL